MTDIILKPPGPNVEAYLSNTYTLVVQFEADALPVGSWTARIVRVLAASFDVADGFEALDVSVDTGADKLTIVLPPTSPLVGSDVQLQLLLGSQVMAALPLYPSTRPDAPTLDPLMLVLADESTVTVTIGGAPGPTGAQGEPGEPGADGADGADGTNGTDGEDGEPGADGADGVGVPAGGTTGQVLAKASDTDFDDEWVDAGAATVDSVNGQTGVVVLTAGDVGADSAGTAAALVDDGSGVTDPAAFRAALELADVAATGDYSDLTGTPVLGTAASADTGTGPTDVILGNDARLTDARPPDPHAASHAAAGTDPVTLTQAQITGLVAALAAKALAADLTTEIADRTAADTAEGSARSAADTAEATARTAADIAEAAARVAGDALLIPLAQKAAVNGVASLDGSGLIPAAQLPAVAISDTFVVASQAAMLALTAQRGDVAVRTDLSKSFILSTDSPGTLADWKELLTPADAVSSVNGRTGAVTGLAEQTALDTETTDRMSFDDLLADALADEITARTATDSDVTALTAAVGTEIADRIAADLLFQPLNTANLSAIAALTTTPYGRSLLEAATPAALRTLAALGTLATLSSVATANLDNNAVTNAKAAQMPASTLKGNNTGGTANAADLTVAQAKTLLAIAAGDVSGLGALATLSAVGSAQITDGSVTNADLADMPTQTIKARVTAGTGPPENATTAQLKALLAGSDVQTFVAGGTWAPPAGAVASSIVETHAIGGGGGSGSGRKGAAGTVRCGGGGGGGGGYAVGRFTVGDLPSTVGVTVGAAGTGGAAQATNSTNGNAGGNGGDSYFGDTAAGAYVVGPGGSGGTGGTNAAGAGGGTTQAMFAGGSGGAADTSGGAGNNAANTAQGAAGGGAGGGITTGNVFAGGGNGGRSGQRKGTTAPAGGAFSGIGGTNATSPSSTAPLAGNGAGGGSSSVTGAGGSGGAGILGGGGGGGGAAVDATGNSGAGGAGGAGLVVVITRI